MSSSRWAPKRHGRRGERLRVSPSSWVVSATQSELVSSRACPARAGQARDETSSDWVADTTHDDGDTRSRSPRRPCRFGAHRDDDIYLVLDQLAGQLIETIAPATGEAVLEVDVLLLDPAKLAQLFPQRDARALGPIDPGRAQEEQTHLRLPGLLAMDGERREREAESENDREPDPPHGHLGGGRLPGSLADEPGSGPRRPTDRSHGTRNGHPRGITRLTRSSLAGIGPGDRVNETGPGRTFPARHEWAVQSAALRQKRNEAPTSR